ncbi:MAG TPA: biotin--[acetyl-CoA-carboxylase] ligase [Candidatus Bathyarchaeia archaeon]|nr:biotin--[acetyl-CoA-carboxylase] ligase [Candidatus Bathyarchaeia archaeon]
MLTEANPLSISGIRGRLSSLAAGHQLFLFHEVESTNATLSRLARSGAAEGTVVLAERQTAGRGRLGQPWFSPAGVNLYLSVLFRGALSLDAAPIFSFIAGLALTDAVRATGAVAAIKWPNDVLVGGRKIGGARIECAAQGKDVDYLIVGIGVNLNVELDALAAALGPAAAHATSLRAAIGREVHRDAFAADYLNALDEWARRYRREGPEPILTTWRERDILTGRQVEVRGGDQPFVGRVAGVDPHGRLIVQDAVGDRRPVTVEEIRPCD